MDETKMKNKPLISGPYYKEILREMRTIAIVFAAIQLLFGLIGEFGSDIRLLFSAVTGNIIKTDIFLIYFFVAAMNFHSGHLSRGSWDFRGSLPIAKKTMAATHLLATLTYAGVIFIAHFIGVAIGEIIIRIPGIEVSAIPPAFGASALSMFKNILYGILLYGGMMILGSVIANMFSFLVAGFVVISLPDLFSSVAGELSVGGSNLATTFLPIGTRGHETLGWILLIIGAAAAAVLGVVAYSGARAETFGKPARKNWIHIATGIGLAMVVGLTVLNIGFSQIVRAIGRSINGSAGFETRDYVIVFTIAIVLMLIVYTAYMWITLRSFKKACKRIVFLPIAAVLMALVIPVAMLANAKWEKVDFRAANIDHVTILDGTLEAPGQEYYIGLNDAYSEIRGRSGAERVKLDDPALIKLVAAEAEEVRSSMMNPDSLSESLSYAILGMYSEPCMEITLKDGSTWTLPISRAFVSTYVAPYAMKNEKYVEKFASMDRFRGGRVFTPSNLGKDFEKTLFDELKAMSPAERAEVFFSNPYSPDFLTDSASDVVYTQTFPKESEYGTVTIVSPTYDHSIKVTITDRMPKTAALYVKLMNERTQNWKNFDEMTRRLESGDYGSISAMLTCENGTNMIYITPKDRGQNRDYTEKTLEASRILAQAMKRDVNLTDTKHLVSLNVDQFSCGDGNNSNPESFYENELIRDGSKQIFVTLTDDELKLIQDLFFNNVWEQYPDEYYEE